MKALHVTIIFLMLFAVMGCNSRENIVDKKKLFGYDYRLYQNTPVWKLAKAVEDENLAAIEEEIERKGVNPNYRDPQFDGTLLMMAIRNGALKSVKALLEFGAEPNLQSDRGANAIIYGAKADSPDYLKLLLKHGGNPNANEANPGSEQNPVQETALTAAIAYGDKSSFEKVKLLVEAGAQVNFSNEMPTRQPIAQAIKFDKMDIALYLLHHGADYSTMMWEIPRSHKVFILEALRTSLIPLDSEQYSRKRQVIFFLRSKGLDYDKEPVPEHVMREIKEKHHTNWQEYLKKY